MQPALQTSTEFLYLASKMMTSGGRYGLVITWLESFLFFYFLAERTYINFLVIVSRLLFNSEWWQNVPDVLVTGLEPVVSCQDRIKYRIRRCLVHSSTW